MLTEHIENSLDQSDCALQTRIPRGGGLRCAVRRGLMGPGTGNSLSLRQVQIALRNGTEGKGLHLLRYARDGKRYRLIG